MKVYVAGPITKGDQFLNVRAAFDAASQLLRAGHTPFVPHANCFWHMIHPESYEDWCRWDNEWLLACDAVVRLSGDSPGADAEVALAMRNQIPVWYSVEGLLEWTGADLPYEDES